MKRRTFLSRAGTTAAGLSAGTARAMGGGPSGNPYPAGSRGGRIERIGGHTLDDLRGHFHAELFERTIPLWDEPGVVDWKYGGYLPHVDGNGRIIVQNKQLYYQGRVLWLYSYFYNHFGREDRHLKAAACGYDFLKRHCLLDTFDWCTEVTREGEIVTPLYDIYASIFTILGLGEYYIATGDDEARELAAKSAFRVTEIILSPHYQAQGHGPWYEPGTKRLGTWLHVLSVLTPFLRAADDPGIHKIARMCVRYMLQYHWQADKGFAYEALMQDFTPYPDDMFIDEEARTTQNTARWVNNFHTMEAAWMIMDEALRTGNREMFRAAVEFGKSHLEKYWVVRGDEQGIVQFLRPDDPDPVAGRDIVKPYVFKEIFIMLLMMIEHTGDDWAVEWFARSFDYAYNKPLEWPWRDTLHQPRGVMFCLEIMDRMIARGGRVSSFFREG